MRLLLQICVLLICISARASQRAKRADFLPYRTGKKVASQVSNALDRLLFFSGYDKQIRPGMGGPPVTVEINLSIRSMGPVDEGRMAYSLDCYFRQVWYDERLKFNATGISELALNWAFLAKIWVPDTYFVNGMKSYLHKITVPNRFVRISPDGKVSYSQRLTLWATCPMNLRKFPLDSQMCPLVIGSFGYNAEDVVYKWKQPKAVSIDKLGLAQFHLVDYKSYESFENVNRRTREGMRNDSTATLNFNFERQTGFFLLQIYTPLTLIVFCSWVAFWLIKTEKGGEVPARTALGATSVLSVVNIGFGGKSRPQVGYATALDTFIILCFFAVFAALVEFACINFIDTFVKRRKIKQELLKKVPCETQANVEIIQEIVAGSGSNGVKGDVPLAEDETAFEDIEEDTANPELPKRPKMDVFWDNVKIILNQCSDSLFGSVEKWIERRWGPIEERFFYNNTTEVIWSIDSYARKGFPLVFLLLQIIYWTSYLYLLSDE